MNAEERRKIVDALLKLTPIGVAFVSEEMRGTPDEGLVTLPMKHLKSVASVMRTLKVMVYGEHKETA